MKLHMTEIPSSTQEVVINRRLFDSGCKTIPIDLLTQEPQLIPDNYSEDDVLSVSSPNDSFDDELAIYAKPTDHKVMRLGTLAGQLQKDRETMQHSRETLSRDVRDIYSTIEALSSALLLRKREDLLTF